MAVKQPTFLRNLYIIFESKGIIYVKKCFCKENRCILNKSFPISITKTTTSDAKRDKFDFFCINFAVKSTTLIRNIPSNILNNQT